jgi:hypothetical protein
MCRRSRSPATADAIFANLREKAMHLGYGKVCAMMVRQEVLNGQRIVGIKYISLPNNVFKVQMGAHNGISV